MDAYDLSFEIDFDLIVSSSYLIWHSMTEKTLPSSNHNEQVQMSREYLIVMKWVPCIDDQQQQKVILYSEYGWKRGFLMRFTYQLWKVIPNFEEIFKPIPKRNLYTVAEDSYSNVMHYLISKFWRTKNESSFFEIQWKSSPIKMCSGYFLKEISSLNIHLIAK